MTRSPEPSVVVRPYGTTRAGEPALVATLVLPGKLSVSITNYGGTITAIDVPDRNGAVANVVLTQPNLEGFEAGTAYFGALVGRVGNRIAHGRFQLDGKTYALAANNTPGGIPCHLHGGMVGFNRKVWKAHAGLEDGLPFLQLSLLSPDGEEGYPGNLNVTVTYRLTRDAGLRIDYQATTDAPTLVNLTNHAYFNLAAEGTILDHRLKLHAGEFTPVNPGMIPLGDLASVEGTPFDFRTETTIGARIDSDDEQLKRGQGYDHNYVVDGTAGVLRPVAEVSEPASGRFMQVASTEPGVQFYSGNYLDGQTNRATGGKFARRAAFCLETQHFPDSPNQPAFPSITLRPGETYRSTTVYTFGCR